MYTARHVQLVHRIRRTVASFLSAPELRNPSVHRGDQLSETLNYIADVQQSFKPWIC